MRDPNNVWPPPPSNTPPIQEPKAPPRGRWAGNIAFSCLMMNLVLIIVWLVSTGAGVKLSSTAAGFGGLSAFALALTGVIFGIVGRKTRQGKYGLWGSALILSLFVAAIVAAVKSEG